MMRRSYVLLALLAVMLMQTACNSRQEHPKLIIEVKNPMTPVKDQGSRQTCWIYAMLAAIETEHIGRGDSVNLSPAWIESRLRDEPLSPASERGMAATLIALIGRHGIVGYDAMRSTDTPPPTRVFMLGTEYTPLEFAHSVCAPDEWVALTSTTRAPYGSEVMLEEPDNWLRQRFLNVPIDTLLQRTERAVSRGHGVSWESRRHAMAIVGLARDTVNQRRYFVMKNSWGTTHGDRGLDYLSFDDFRRHTLSVCMTRDAFENEI